MKTSVLTLSVLLSSAAFANDAADVYKAKCKSCHGETGKADTKNGKKYKMHDISTERWQARHSDEQIRKVISDGDPDNEKMKAFKDKLSPEQIDALVQHIRTFRGK